MMREATLMKCGCVAQGVLRAKGGVTFDPPIPSCLVHDCTDVADAMPDLAGRMAECAYLPNGHALKPSSFELPFFVFRGEGSPEATEKCKCRSSWIAHQPRWRAEIKVVHRWHKIERDESVVTKEFHAPPDMKEARAEVDANFFRYQTRDEQTKVYSAEVTSIKEIRSPLKCREFVAHGPHKFDQYYCGCHGWD